MSSVSKKGNSYYIRISIDGTQRKIYGFTNKRIAERAGEKIENLLTCRLSGGLTDEIRLWLKEIENSTLYDKLAQLGLVEERQKPHTLGDLLTAYCLRVTEERDSMRKNCKMVSDNLVAFFGKETILAGITREQAEAFVYWLRTEKLNRRGKQPQKYSDGTVGRRIVFVKQIFSYGRRLGWLERDPFEYVKGWEACNRETLAYIFINEVLEVITHAPFKWRVIIALGRFAGVRGASELYKMKWNDVHWTEAGKPGWLRIQSPKKGDERVVPLVEPLEEVLTDWYFQSEGTDEIFPGMSKHQNFSVVVTKLFRKAFGKSPRKCWYNLRRSFCSDLVKSGLDPAVYEQISGHSLRVSMKHYQILSESRLSDGMVKAAKVFHSATPEMRGLKRGLPGGLKRGLHCIAEKSDKMNQSSEVLENREDTCIKKPACISVQTGRIHSTGFEPVTFGSVDRFCRPGKINAGYTISRIL